MAGDMTDNEGIYNLVLYKQCPSWYTNKVLCYMGRGFEIPDTGYYRICQGGSRDTVLSVSRQISIRYDGIPVIAFLKLNWQDRGNIPLL